MTYGVLLPDENQASLYIGWISLDAQTFVLEFSKEDEFAKNMASEKLALQVETNCDHTQMIMQ
jgi:hypothetical protein